MSRTAVLMMDVEPNHLPHAPADYLPRARRALDTARAAGSPRLPPARHGEGVE